MLLSSAYMEQVLLSLRKILSTFQFKARARWTDITSRRTKHYHISQATARNNIDRRDYSNWGCCLGFCCERENPGVRNLSAIVSLKQSRSNTCSETICLIVTGPESRHPSRVLRLDWEHINPPKPSSEHRNILRNKLEAQTSKPRLNLTHV